MNTIIKRVWNQNRMVNIEALSGMAFQAEDGGHTFEISGINDANEAVSLSGTVAGVFMRPDGTDVALTGTASDGVVSVTLSDACYAVAGRFGLTIFVTADSQKVAVYAAVGTVTRTSGGAVAGDTPQDVVDLINAINAAVATIPADYTALMAAIAPTYSSSALYAKGAYAWYNGVLYRCATAITTAESWTAAHWTAAVIGNDVADLKSALAKVANILPEIETITSNGVTLTNNSDGSYTLTGTATADTNITFYTSATDVSNWLERGKKYYAIIQGLNSGGARFIVTTRPGYVFLARTRGTLVSFEVPSSGGMMIAINIDVGSTFDDTICPVIFEKSYFPEIYLPKREITVAKDGTGDFSSIKYAIAYANEFEGTTIRIQAGSYDLVAEFGKAYLDGLSDNNPDYGLYLGNGVKIICSPRAHLYFDYDGTNEWVVRYFSPFNTSNYIGYEVIGMNIGAHNCRYIVHDDPLWGTKENFSHNVWKDCYFEMFPSPQVASWVNHQIIGGGFGYNTLIDVDSCIFNAHYSGVDHYSSLSYHNDVSGATGAKSMLTVKNCYFADGNRIILQGYGAATEKSNAVICGNSFGDASTDIVYDSSSADNIAVYQFNNESR